MKENKGAAMLKITFTILGLFKGLLRLLKVDYEKVRTILEMKLVADSRRSYQNVHVKKDKKSGEDKNSFTKLLWLHVASGMFLGYFVYEMDSLFLSLFLVHTFSLVMAVMALLSHFSNVLLDTADNIILLSRPVDSRTVFVSRLIHILFYLFAIMGALALVPAVVGTYRFGFTFLLTFLITLIFSTLLGVCLVYTLYLVVMNVSGSSRFRDTLTYIQIIVPLGFLAFFMTSGGSKNFEMKSMMMSIDSWVYWAPPAWFAGITDGVVNNRYGGPFPWFTLLTLVVPIACFVAAVLFLAPGFNRKLASMDSFTSKRDTAPTKNLIAGFLSKLFTHRGTERAAFLLTWKLSGRDSKFKLNTYSILGAVIGFAFMLVITLHKNFWVALTLLPGTSRHLGILYISSILMANALTQLPFSDSFRGAWIYQALPLEKPGEILTGAFKAVIVKFSFIFVLAVIFVFSVWGWRVSGDILLSFLNILLFCLLLAFVFLRTFPFSQEHSIAGLSGKVFSSLAVLVVFAGLVYLHFRFRQDFLVVPGAILILATLVVFLSRKYSKTFSPGL